VNQPASALSGNTPTQELSSPARAVNGELQHLHSLFVLFESKSIRRIEANSTASESNLYCIQLGFRSSNAFFVKKIWRSMVLQTTLGHKEFGRTTQDSCVASLASI